MLAIFGDICAGPALGAAINDPLVVDAHTGLAISGFDPVAYFTDAKPKFGRPDLELRMDGAVWRFQNEGNRAAFAEHPEVYTPCFGGFDPVAIARGASVPGHPLFWAVTGERLYLFYSAEARAAFLADPGRIIERAMRNWPEVARSIAR
ncbi:MAG: YHS domain-containing (seleno)protein [Pseudolabrys sp.]